MFHITQDEIENDQKSLAAWYSPKISCQFQCIMILKKIVSKKKPLHCAQKNDAQNCIINQMPTLF